MMCIYIYIYLHMYVYTFLNRIEINRKSIYKKILDLFFIEISSALVRRGANEIKGRKIKKKKKQKKEKKGVDRCARNVHALRLSEHHW